jgi:hypothetical protein
MLASHQHRNPEAIERERQTLSSIGRNGLCKLVYGGPLVPGVREWLKAIASETEGRL